MISKDIKLIVSDLDRTILKKDKTISNYTKVVLSKIKDRGIIFAIATARPIRAVKGVISDLSFDASIYHNGAIVFYEDVLLGHFSINKLVAQKIIKKILADYKEARVAIEIGDHLYANFNATDIWKNIDYTEIDYMKSLRDDVDKVIIDISNENISKYSKYLRDDLYIVDSEKQVGMIMQKNATKAAGVKALCKHLDISMENVLAFGDDYNDISMLRESGIGVAMANAIEEVKSQADYIAESNENDGVSKWIDKHILNK